MNINILLDPDLVQEWGLVRKSKLFNSAMTLLDIVSDQNFMCKSKAYICEIGLNNIFSILKMKSLDQASEFTNKIEDRFIVLTGSNEMFQKARNYDYNLETSVELLLSHENHLDAIVTENPNKYKSSPFLRHLPIWSVQKLSTVYQLEKNFQINTITDDNNDGQIKLFPYQCKSNLSEYRIRNTHTVTLKVFNHLKKAGVKGLRKTDLASTMGRSMETIKSIIWDLEHFGMIDCSGDYILAKKIYLIQAKMI